MFSVVDEMPLAQFHKDKGGGGPGAIPTAGPFVMMMDMAMQAFKGQHNFDALMLVGAKNDKGERLVNLLGTRM